MRAGVSTAAPRQRSGVDFLVPMPSLLQARYDLSSSGYNLESESPFAVIDIASEAA